MNLQPVKPDKWGMVYYVVCRGCIGTGRDSIVHINQAYADLDHTGAYYCPTCALSLMSGVSNEKLIQHL